MADIPTTQLESVIQTAIDTNLKELHTCLPAIVDKVNHVDQLVDVQITIKRKLDGELVNLPMLVDVPVRFLKSSTFSITFPIEVGDNVLIIFAERSIDKWLTDGGLQNPFDVRRHSLSDAFALPMMYHQQDVIPSFDTANLQIKVNDGSGSITITPGGEIQLNGDADTAIAFTDMKAAFDDLKTQLNDFMTVYNTHTHPTAATGPPSVPSATGVAATADMAGAEVSTVKVP